MQNLVVGFDLQTSPIVIRIHDRSNNEQLVIKYQGQEIQFHIDLAFKELLTLKAFGLEIQSRRSIYSLWDLIFSLFEDYKKTKEILSSEIWYANWDTYTQN